MTNQQITTRRAALSRVEQTFKDIIQWVEITAPLPGHDIPNVIGDSEPGHRGGGGCKL